jgi:dTDP-4-amino-4,6-dideoxygalactose transaminase
LREKNQRKNKLIVPVHYSGNPVNLKELSEIAQEYNLKLLKMQLIQ